MSRLGTVLAMLLLLGAAGWGQEPGKPGEAEKPAAGQEASAAAAQARPAANPEDVKSIDAIVKAIYECVSGPAGQKHDWQRFRSLYWPGARLIPTGRRLTGEMGTRVLSVEEYIASAQPYLEKNSFYESEVARQVNQYGHMAQVFSTYASRRAPGEEPFARGINGIDLVNDGQRWWVLTVFWENESAGNPIPKKYLKP
jgi:hypothetical protein